MVTKIITIVLFCLFYWFCCFLATGTDKKNLLGLRSYPDAVQQAVRKHPEFGRDIPQEKSIASILFGNLLLFTVAFSIMGIAMKNLLGLHEWRVAFAFFLALGEGLGLFDLVAIDLLWWRNTKRIRFSFLPNRADYQDPENHIQSFLRGIPLFAIVAVLSAVVVTCIP